MRALKAVKLILLGTIVAGKVSSQYHAIVIEDGGWSENGG